MTDSTVTPTPATTPKTNAPVFKINLGTISVALFSGDKSTSQGDIFLAQDIVLEKSWKKPDGSYDSRKITVDPKEVMKVIAGLQQAYLAANNERHGQ